MAVESLGTVDTVIRKLKDMKHQVGGNAQVFVSIPYNDGLGFRNAEIKGIHVANSVVNIVVPK